MCPAVSFNIAMNHDMMLLIMFLCFRNNTFLIVLHGIGNIIINEGKIMNNRKIIVIRTLSIFIAAILKMQ